MRTVVAVFLVASLSPLTAVAVQGANKPAWVEVQWSLALDAQGKVTALDALRPRYLPAVEGRLEPVIRTWHFRPGEINGVPAPTQTTLSISLDIERMDDETYRVRILTAHTGAGVAKATPPSYPGSAVRSHEAGGVVVRASYDANGRVVDARPEDVAIEPRAGGPDLQRASVNAVRHWTFKPETVAGHGVAGVVLVPICYSLGGHGGNCRWALPGRSQPTAEGQPVSLASAVHLDTDVTGDLP